jgi:uncharacterized protein DUF4331
MSSHREAPETSKDPVADNTDTYAFVSPDKPDTVTVITKSAGRSEPLRVRRRRPVLHLHRQRRRRINDLGFIIVAVFLATWTVSLLIWRLAHIEERWTASVREAEPAD